MATKAEVEQLKGLLRKQLEVERHMRAKAEEAIRIAVEAERNKQIASAISDGLQWRVDELEAENAKLRDLVRDMYRSMDVSCQFGHAIPAGTMAHIKNRVIGLGVEVDR